MRNWEDGNIENGMVLFDERDYWRCEEENSEDEIDRECEEEEDD